ncbi:MAG: YidB family protein [Beijerinckiaceae bacterium]
MGILDNVLGGLLGSQQQGSAPSPASSSGMSPMLKAVLLLLATKAYHDYTTRGAGQGTMPGSSGAMPDRPPMGGAGGGLGGGLGGLLGGLGGGGLGGLLGGLGGAGAIGSLIDQFRQKGYGDQVNSWVGTGQNQPIAPNQVADALGSDTIDQLSRQFQMPRDQMLSELSRELPSAIDHATPQGRVPDDAELRSRWV